MPNLLTDWAFSYLCCNAFQLFGLDKRSNGGKYMRPVLVVKPLYLEIYSAARGDTSPRQAVPPSPRS